MDTKNKIEEIREEKLKKGTLKYSDWNKTQLIKEIERLRKRKKYGIVFEEKPENVVEQCKKELPVLKEVVSKQISSADESSMNILIEGDNFHALSVLNYTHKGKIDVIYIDPPYNTGNKDFKYNDAYVDREDGYRHSKWLSFMEKRLVLAKNLLKESGTIFISIDDNEVAQLKLLCDSIFPSGSIGTLIWKTRQATGKQVASSNVSSEHEYVLCYSKNSDKVFFKGSERNRDSYKNPDNDPRGDWAKHPLDIGATRYERPNCFYTLVDPDTGIKYPAKPNRVWAFSKESMAGLIKEKKIIFDPKGKNRPALKKFWKELKSELKPFSSFISNEEYDIGYNTEGTKMLNRIFSGNKVFDYPKPVSLIKILVGQVANSSSLVLDFMAGSGTTGHAVLELNEEDKGNRRFILCTNNENNIASEVCYPRVAKIMRGYKNGNGEKVDGLGGNLKYFKTAFVGAEPNDKNKEMLTREATEMLCMREDTFIPVKETKLVKIFRGNKRHTGIVFDEDAIETLKKEIAKIGGNWSVYIFSLSDDTFDEEFENIKNVSVAPIPEAILRVYRRIFQK